jgi:hypothetical protein
MQVSRRARKNGPDEKPAPNGVEASLSDAPYHVVEISVDAPDATLFAGARGTARIAAERSTLGELALLRLRRAFTRAF